MKTACTTASVCNKPRIGAELLSVMRHVRPRISPKNVLFTFSLVLTLVLTCWSNTGKSQDTSAKRPAVTCVNSKGTRINQAKSTVRGQLHPLESPVPVFVMIHTVAHTGASEGQSMIGSLREVLGDLLLACERTGVYELATNITINVVGNGYVLVKDFVEVDFDKRFQKIQVMNLHENPHTWEFSSINLLLDYAKELAAAGKEAHMLYIHTKGMHRTGDPVAKWHWRKFLEYWVLEHQVDARGLLLQGYDAVGSNAINFSGGAEVEAKTRVNPAHGWHYSGNFWWSTSNHLARHAHLKIQPDHKIDSWERCKAEFTVLSRLPDMCAGELHHSTHAHMYSLGSIPSLWELSNSEASTKLLLSGARRMSLLRPSDVIGTNSSLNTVLSHKETH
mmetsp:Transcript_6787/g.15020  ORF Transcript_6787/g.15020 Transcript_6787/m.15020 type:complete len:391 (-) Transcript_6787:165-1337(-)|eukprot:CAMPEP_0179617616 /NCGR_PEP_ID=MMETSP0930-20121108/7252_1 /TAXON_ID=548131 ORGANISM="Ostreococcus mediterraneus, Strain clade-D-RCC1621" /NCGR_SAMPLE_ID=MMETSP0930 /ASSEMBLY_ACC=CAM_ASM_000580 /LENGTH=390 /DNA_ID=CAMNT_0021486529 /DNA_START=113 /DNA_END=1285 /DNA_ORIENTATION=-